MLVYSADVEVHIGMRLCESLDSLGSRDDAQEMKLSAAVLLEHLNCFQSGAAGSQHGIDDEDLSLRTISGKLAVVFYRSQRLGISVKTDVTDFRRGDHCQHAVYHAKARSQDRNDRELLALDLLNGCLADGRLNLNVFELQVSGRLIAFEHSDLADGLAELLGSDLLAPDQADLVLDQRVIHDKYIFHFSPPSY